MVKQKQNFGQDLIIIKVHTGHIENKNVSEHCFNEYYGQHNHNGTDDWQFLN